MPRTHSGDPRSVAANASRSGYSLVELLIAMVVVGVIAVGFTRLITSQTRFYDNAMGQRNARTVARNSMNILLSDLRMVQDSGGIDSTAADGKTIRVLVPYRYGLVCAVTGTLTTVSMLPTDSATLSMSTFKGYAWRDGTTGRYTLVSGGASPVLSATPLLCTGTGAGQAGLRTVSVAGRTGGNFDLSPAAPGAVAGNAVFFYQRVTYSFGASSRYSGRVGLWRSIDGGRSDELMAPFDTSARFQFYTAGTDVSVVTPPALALIRGVDLVLTGESERTSKGNAGPSESKMITSVFFKNVRAQ